MLISFVQFACGGWVDNQVIPEDKTSVSVFSLLQDELNNKLRGNSFLVQTLKSISIASTVLVEMPADEKEPKFFEKMRNMYKSCMNLGEWRNS